MASTVILDWQGAQVLTKAKRAIERAEVATLEEASAEATRVVHRITGTLARSIHAAPIDYVGPADESVARSGRKIMNAADIPTWQGWQAMGEVGSWISYAIYEERRHPYLAPSFHMATQQFTTKLHQAFDSEFKGIVP